MKNLQLEMIDANDKYQILKIVTLGNGIIEVKDLPTISLPKNAEQSKGVIIYGKSPIWLYAYLVHECHSFAWVAVFDPRVGGIVVQTHVANSFKVGDIIPLEEIKDYITKYDLQSEKQSKSIEANKAIAIVGPPHSGKSVFLQKIKEMLTAKIEYNDDFFIFRACPDGEGNWSGEINQELRDAIREKKVFDDDFPQITASQINELRKTKKLVFVDCGGIIDKKNQIIMSACNAAIIISSQKDVVAEWIGACKSAELEILSIINSVWENKSVIVKQNPLTFEIGKFDRNALDGVDIPKELCDLIQGFL
jgi:CRISPR-associated protein Csx3